MTKDKADAGLPPTSKSGGLKRGYIRHLPWPSDEPSLSCGRRLYNELTYSYMNPILRKGANQFKDHGEPLTLDDLYRAPSSLEADVLVEEFRYVSIFVAETFFE